MDFRLLIQKSFERFGYSLKRLKRTRPIDLRACGNDPRSLAYLSDIQPAIIEAPMILGRGAPFFSFADASHHPVVIAARAYMAAGNSEAALTSVLCNFYSNVTPRSVAEVLGVAPFASPLLDEVPPWATVFPWDDHALEER